MAVTVSLPSRATTCNRTAIRGGPSRFWVCLSLAVVPVRYPAFNSGPPPFPIDVVNPQGLSAVRVQEFGPKQNRGGVVGAKEKLAPRSIPAWTSSSRTRIPAGIGISSVLASSAYNLAVNPDVHRDSLCPKGNGQSKRRTCQTL